MLGDIGKIGSGSLRKTKADTTNEPKEDPSIAKGKMLGDIGKIGSGSLRKTKADTTNEPKEDP
eukprot:scaffold162843_cov26-Cyclotella_meneghiniana.AAC.1